MFLHYDADLAREESMLDSLPQQRTELDGGLQRKEKFSEQFPMETRQSVKGTLLAEAGHLSEALNHILHVGRAPWRVWRGELDQG